MNGETSIQNEDKGMTFDLKDMTEAERKAMFMRVSVRSLGIWLGYYKGRQQHKVCSEIREILDYKNRPAH